MKKTGRVALTTEPIKEVELDQSKIDGAMAQMRADGATELQALDNAAALAKQLNYEGTLTVVALEDEIRFYQRRSVEALLETGKRLLLLKEVTPHGEFEQRVESLGISRSSAGRIMLAAKKTAKSPNLGFLSSQVKSASAFLELVTHDEDVLENIAEMTDLDRLSASQLKAKVLETQQALEDAKKISAKKSERIAAQQEEIDRISVLPPDEALADLQRKATTLMNDAQGCIRGQLRQALIALRNHGDEDHSLFMAGLVGQVQADLTALREEFDLPDVSHAAQAELAAEVAQWAKD